MYIWLDAYLSFDKNWTKRNIRFFFFLNSTNCTKLARSHKSDASLSILTAELLESVTWGMFSVLFMDVLTNILWNAWLNTSSKRFSSKLRSVQLVGATRPNKDKRLWINVTYTSLRCFSPDLLLQFRLVFCGVISWRGNETSWNIAKLKVSAFHGTFEVFEISCSQKEESDSQRTRRITDNPSISTENNQLLEHPASLTLDSA